MCSVTIWRSASRPCRRTIRGMRSANRSPSTYQRSSWNSRCAANQRHTRAYLASVMNRSSSSMPIRRPFRSSAPSGGWPPRSGLLLQEPVRQVHKGQVVARVLRRTLELEHGRLQRAYGAVGGHVEVDIAGEVGLPVDETAGLQVLEW